LYGTDTYNNGPILSSSDFVTMDGIFTGRGWTNSLTGQVYINENYGYFKTSFTVEYRIPIYDKIIWAAGFIDTINLIQGPYIERKDNDGNTYKDRSKSWQWWSAEKTSYLDQRSYQPFGIDNWFFSIGGGVEITFPQLPLSFFVVKRFKINHYTGFEWQTNNVGGLDFVLSMVGVSF
jgi:outer membrane protein assembly factor BamA